MARRAPKPPAPAQVLELVAQSLDDDKAQGIVVIDLNHKADITDYMVIASGTSQRHIGAMADHLKERLKAGGLGGLSIEGLPQCDWVLIDAGDVVVHLFRPEVRGFYNLEKLWGAAAPGPDEAAGASV